MRRQRELIPCQLVPAGGSLRVAVRRGVPSRDGLAFEGLPGPLPGHQCGLAAEGLGGLARALQLQRRNGAWLLHFKLNTGCP